MAYSEDRFFDCSDGDVVTWDNIIERAENDEWENFDVEDQIDNCYCNARDLWHDIQIHGEDGVEDQLWHERCNEIYAEAVDSKGSPYEDDTFTVCDRQYRLMRAWGATF